MKFSPPPFVTTISCSFCQLPSQEEIVIIITTKLPTLCSEKNMKSVQICCLESSLKENSLLGESWENSFSSDEHKSWWWRTLTSCVFIFSLPPPPPSPSCRWTFLPKRLHQFLSIASICVSCTELCEGGNSTLDDYLFTLSAHTTCITPLIFLNESKEREFLFLLHSERWFCRHVLHSMAVIFEREMGEKFIPSHRLFFSPFALMFNVLCLFLTCYERGREKAFNIVCVM